MLCIEINPRPRELMNRLVLPFVLAATLVACDTAEDQDAPWNDREPSADQLRLEQIFTQGGLSLTGTGTVTREGCALTGESTMTIDPRVNDTTQDTPSPFSVTTITRGTYGSGAAGENCPVLYPDELHGWPATGYIQPPYFQFFYGGCSLIDGDARGWGDWTIATEDGAETVTINGNYSCRASSGEAPVYEVVFEVSGGV